MKVEDLHHIIFFSIISLCFRAAFDLLDSSPSFDLITLNNNIDKPQKKFAPLIINQGSIVKEVEIDVSVWGGKYQY